MSDYTPTTDEMLDGYVTMRRREIPGDRVLASVQALGEAERWLAAHDAAKRAEWEAEQGEPTAAQVEAGAREAFFTDDAGGHIRGGYTWDTIPEIGRQNYRTMVRAVLHAALCAADTQGDAS